MPEQDLGWIERLLDPFLGTVTMLLFYVRCSPAIVKPIITKCLSPTLETTSRYPLGF